MPRDIQEWFGITDNSMPPPRVRLRVFEKHQGACHICSGKILVGQKWQCDHIKALILGGENRELNLAPVHILCHIVKTGLDTKQKSKSYRIRAKHYGIRPKKKVLPFGRNSSFKRKIDGTIVKRET